MTIDGTDVIVNGEAVHVSETVGGGTAPVVVESESVDENGESVSVIFDGATALVNGEVVTASEEGSTVMINGEEISITFDRSNVVVNVEAVSVAAPVAAVLNVEVANEVVAGVAGAAGEVISEAATLEAILPPSIDVNWEGVSVMYDGSIAVVNGHAVIATMYGIFLRR